MMQHVLYSLCSQMCTETGCPESKSKPNHMTVNMKVRPTLVLMGHCSCIAAMKRNLLELYWNIQIAKVK